MGLADLHIHTVHSDGMGTVPAVLQTAVQNGLDVIAITDHSEIRGALEALDLAPSYGIEVVPGIEVATADGHLLALYVTERIPDGERLRDTVLRVADLGGLCVAAHPMASWIKSLSASCIIWALTDPIVAKTLVGLEVYNAGLPVLRHNKRAQALGDRTGLSQLANTDSHLIWTIGMCATQFPGKTAADARHALENRLTVPVINQRPFTYFTGWMKGLVMRRAGMAYCSSQPNAQIVIRRLSSIQP